MRKKKNDYKLKELPVSVLRETQGKVRTEELFSRDCRLAIMFVRYMRDNAEYLNRYEEDKAYYDDMVEELNVMLKRLRVLDKDFKERL